MRNNEKNWNERKTENIVTEGEIKAALDPVEVTGEVPAEMAQPEEPNVSSYKEVTIGNCKKLNVRKGAGKSFPVIAVIPEGTIVELIEVVDGWANIHVPSAETADYIDGFVMADYILL